MKWEEIEKNYKEQWALIECTKVTPDTFEILDGNVLYHNSDMGKVYTKLLEMRPKEYTMEYIGKFPENIAVVL
jgi:hypothetical protein